MPGIKVDHNRKRITLSQSWLQDFARCAERGRWEWLHPSESKNDALGVGTATHLYLEDRLLGADRETARDAAVEWLEFTRQEPDFRMVKVVKPETMFKHLETCLGRFERHILPCVPRGGRVEQTMKAVLGTYEDYEIVLAGTPDYIDPMLRIWDWKTAAGPWNIFEAATWNIQPTAYTFLASETLAEPVNDFTYAVVVKSSGVVQYIDCTRYEEDWLWLRRLCEGAVAMILHMPGEWPVNHMHHLCSEKWCPHWDGCRGRFVSPPSDEDME